MNSQEFPPEFSPKFPPEFSPKFPPEFKKFPGIPAMNSGHNNYREFSEIREFPVALLNIETYITNA